MTDVALPMATSSVPLAPIDVRVGQTEAIPIPEPTKAGIVTGNEGSSEMNTHINKNRDE
jgi:hypothetical protein